MSLPRDDDRFVSMTPATRRLLDELGALDDPKPRLRVRRRGCGCLLARVYRLSSGDLFLADRRGLVHVSPGQRRHSQQYVAWDVASPPADFMTDEVGCQHGIPRLDVPALRAAVAGVSDRGEVLLL